MAVRNLHKSKFAKISKNFPREKQVTFWAYIFSKHEKIIMCFPYFLALKIELLARFKIINEYLTMISLVMPLVEISLPFEKCSDGYKFMTNGFSISFEGGYTNTRRNVMLTPDLDGDGF